jgi:hypothetical protein
MADELLMRPGVRDGSEVKMKPNEAHILTYVFN